MTEEADSTIHPAVQFLLLIVYLLGFMIAGFIIGAIIAMILYGVPALMDAFAFKTEAPHVITIVWILQIFSGTIPLFVAPVLFARYSVQQPKAYLKTTFKIDLLLPLIILVILLCFSPMMELVVNINQKMSFPQGLKWIEQWMREKEDLAAKETQALLKMNSLSGMLFVLLEIGLLTAIAEEFLFRGCVQAIFTRWTKNPHWGIWITAILFSAFHLQFFGFLPRMLLGAGFGYFVWWSGSIWTSVWAHFINNGTAVIVTYLYQQKTIKLNPDDQHVFNYGAYAFSLIITVLLLILYRKITLTKKQPLAAL